MQLRLGTCLCFPVHRSLFMTLEALLGAYALRTGTGLVNRHFISVNTSLDTWKFALLLNLLYLVSTSLVQLFFLFLRVCVCVRKV